MLLGFKKQFADWVESGTKTHTIRAPRVIRPRVGETCHCYTGLRQKGARLLGRFPLVCVQQVVIWRIEGSRYGVPLTIHIDGARLSDSEANDFFHRDGFRPEAYTGNLRLEAFLYPSIEMAAEFWKDREMPWTGDLIHWKHPNGA